MKTAGALRVASLFLLLFLGCLYLITIGLASWVFNAFLDSGAPNSSIANPVVTAPPNYGNAATPYFAFITLVSGVVGLAAVFLGLQQVMSWRSKPLAAANSATMIAWVLSLLAMGFACKEINLEGGRNHRLRALEAFAILLPWILLLQLAMLHAAIFISPKEKQPAHPYGGAHGPVTTPRSVI